MIVERWDVPVKPGHVEELVEMLAAEKAKIENPETMRIFVSEFGEMSTVSFEIEQESMAAMEEGWKEWGATPDWAEFDEKWNSLIAGGTKRSLWNLVG